MLIHMKANSRTRLVHAAGRSPLQGAGRKSNVRSHLFRQQSTAHAVTLAICGHYTFHNSPLLRRSALEIARRMRASSLCYVTECLCVEIQSYSKYIIVVRAGHWPCAARIAEGKPAVKSAGYASVEASQAGGPPPASAGPPTPKEDPGTHKIQITECALHGNRAQVGDERP